MSSSMRSKSGKAGRRPRNGFTLLELVVVMAILIGLAGILVPMLSNMTTQTADVNVACNADGLGQAIQGYQALNSQYPDGYDSLVLAAGTIAPQIPWAGSTSGNGIMGMNVPAMTFHVYSATAQRRSQV